jgi:hypothetical protein
VASSFKKNKNKMLKSNFTRSQIRTGTIYMIASTCLGILSIAILFYFTMKPSYINTFKHITILWILGAISVFGYIILYYKYIRNKIPYLKYLDFKELNSAGAFVFSFILLPFFILTTNQTLPDSKRKFQKDVLILKMYKEKRSIISAGIYSDNYNHYVNVFYNQSAEKILIDKTQWKSLHTNKTITLHIRTGFWGLDYIDFVSYKK